MSDTRDLEARARVAAQGDDDESPYHAGERAVQARLGVRARAEQMGRHMIHDVITEQQRAFFATLPFVLTGSVDRAGHPWASMLVGPPGFVLPLDEHLLSLRAHALPGDPLARALRPGEPLGLLGIELETRRRNRLNGRISAVSDAGFTLRVDQSFGNCPMYITARAPLATEALAANAPRAEGAHLSQVAKACIAASDTCFIASASAAVAELADPREGVDVSHRGGRPGFVRATEHERGSVLTLPDFSGNNAFNTLGNLARYPRAGLLFPDFETGNLLLVTCSAEIVFDGPEVRAFRGAQRLIRLYVAHGFYYERALPFRWSPARPAAQLAKTGSWDDTEDPVER